MPCEDLGCVFLLHSCSQAALRLHTPHWAEAQGTIWNQVLTPEIFGFLGFVAAIVEVVCSSFLSVEVLFVGFLLLFCLLKSLTQTKGTGQRGKEASRFAV